MASRPCAPLVLMPMPKRLRYEHFGSIAGASGVCHTIGAAIGPIGAGRIYDLTGSYSYALDLFVTACILGTLATLASFSPESEQSRPMSVAITAP